MGKILGKGIEASVVASDKSYDDEGNNDHLQAKGISSAVRLNNYRTPKKDLNKREWLELKQSQPCSGGPDERYKVKRKFGETRKW